MVLARYFPFSTSYSDLIATLLVKTPHTSSSYVMKTAQSKNIFYPHMRFNTSFYRLGKTLKMGLQKDIYKVLMLIRYDLLGFLSLDCSKSNSAIVPNYIISHSNKTSRDSLLRDSVVLECLNKQTDNVPQGFC